MRRLAVVLAVILALASVSAFAVEPYEFLHVSGCENWISLREKPSTSAERLVKIPANVLVKYIADANDEFFEIQYAGKRGYALKSYLAEYNPENGFGDYSVPMYIRKNDTPVYDLPDENGEQIALLPEGKRVACLGKIGGDDAEMALVQYEGVGGYIRLDDLSFVSDLDTPVISGAVMLVPGKDGETFAQQERDETDMQEIAAMLDRAEPGITCQGPVGAQLILHIDDGSGEIEYLRFMLPNDGCPILIAENHTVWQLPEEDGERLWQIFGETQNANFANVW